MTRGSDTFLFATVLILAGSYSAVIAQTRDNNANCERQEFESVVDDAGAALRLLNQANKPKFQDRLRQLKEKMGWSHDAFLEKAVPYVRDDIITVFDAKTAELIAEISTLGAEGAEAEVLDCKVLGELRLRMTKLVDTQRKKWDYMFNKVNNAITSISDQ